MTWKCMLYFHNLNQPDKTERYPAETSNIKPKH